MGYYAVGMACLNGHKIAGNAEGAPEFCGEFCSTCGERTITQCPVCKQNIRGYYQGGGIGYGWTLCAFCHACGKPYPWTVRKAEAIEEMLDELDGLSPEDREKLKKSIPDIIADTPKSETAALRFKKAIAKVGQVGGKMLLDVLTSVATEAVKKAMGL
ncbi:MAG: DUF2321 domain-containing protein [Chloroflexi bacterium]|nr:DUF2321 domain-containing protein [Chloroflexota bacterium]